MTDQHDQHVRDARAHREELIIGFIEALARDAARYEFRQIEVAREVMKRRHAALRELAKR